MSICIPGGRAVDKMLRAAERPVDLNTRRGHKFPNRTNLGIAIGMNLTKKVYRSAPVRLQELGLSAWGLYWKWLRLGGDFERDAGRWRQREGWDSDRLRAFVAARLTETLRLATDRTDHYPELWRRRGLSEDRVMAVTPDTLDELPVTSRRDFHHRPESICTVARAYSFTRSTSGTTGAPLDVRFTPRVYRSAYAAVEARAYGWAGVSVRDRRTTFGARAIVPPRQEKPPFWRRNFAEPQLYLSAFHIAPRWAEDYCRALDRFAPRLMTGYSSSHYLLARMIENRGLSVNSPAAVVPGSDECGPRMRETVERVFGASVYPLYGMVEQCLLATTCERGGLHVHPDFGIVEVVDDNGRAMPPGETGRIVATGLVNTSSLFIRYDTGDTGSLSAESCPCGRDNLPLLADLSGRVEDVVRTPDGRQLRRLDRLFTGLGGIECAQVVQRRPDAILVRLVAAGGPGLEREIRDRAAGMLGQMEVEFEYMEDIPRDSSGKFRPVVSEIAES